MLTRWLHGWGRSLHACSPCVGADEVAAYCKQRKAQQARACCPSQQLSSTCIWLLSAYALDRASLPANTVCGNKVQAGCGRR